MQAMAAGVAGSGMEAAGAGVAGAERSKRGGGAANGEAPDFGIALIAKLQALSIAQQSGAQSSRRAMASASGASSKEGEEFAEPLAQKPPKKDWEDAAAAPVEVVAAVSLRAPVSPEPVNAPVESAERAGVKSSEAANTAEKVFVAGPGQIESLNRSQGFSPAGVSSVETAHEAATERQPMHTESTIVESTGMLGNAAAKAVANPVNGEDLTAKTASVPAQIFQTDGTPLPEAAAGNGVKLVPPQSSLPAMLGNKSEGAPERASAAGGEASDSNWKGPGAESPVSALPGVAANPAMGAAASVYPSSFASAASVAPMTGKSAGKGVATGGAVGATATPAVGGHAATGVAAEGPNGMLAGAAPFGAAGDLGAGRMSAPAAVAPGESFRQIDTAAEPPRFLRTTPSLVEVGVNDSAHGWVEVRAENASGQIRASLSASSIEAQSALHAHLPEMAGYLAERDIGVRSLAVEHGAGAGGSFAGTSGGSGGADPNANGGRSPDPPSSSSAGADGANRSRSSDTSSESDVAMQLANGRGSAIGYSPHTINVVA